MADLETRIEGTPGSIRAVGDWLLSPYASGATAIADTTLKQRSRAASDWQGETGTAFGARASALAVAADTAADTATNAAGLVDDLAQALQTAQSGMQGVRDDAVTGALTVTGTVVRTPGPSPSPAGTLPADATPGETSAWEAADRAVRDHNAAVDVWNACVRGADTIFTAWQEALADAASTWSQYDDELAGLSSDFLSAAAEIALIAKTVPVLVGQAEELKTQAAQARTHAEALRRPDGTIVDRSRYYDLIDKADDLERVQAPRAYQDAVKFELPKGVGRALGVLGVAAAGYGVYADIRDGESVPQAVVSNGVSFGASIVAGAYIGGMVGTAIPIPVVGTVAGVVVGVAVGTVVGAFTSGAIDALWESGMDSLSDAGAAVEGGWNELQETGAAVGSLAEDAWDAIF